MTQYPTKKDIIFVNRKTAKQHGGNFVPPSNFLKEEGLDYLIDAVDGELFGEPLYPNIHDKAGLYLYNVNSNHIFQDGNKRTGLGAALLFLRLNGFCLREQLQESVLAKIEQRHPLHPLLSPNENILYHFVLHTASGDISLEECQQWFADNMVRID